LGIASGVLGFTALAQYRLEIVVLALATFIAYTLQAFFFLRAMNLPELWINGGLAAAWVLACYKCGALLRRQQEPSVSHGPSRRSQVIQCLVVAALLPLSSYGWSLLLTPIDDFIPQAEVSDSPTEQVD